MGLIVVLTYKREERLGLQTQSMDSPLSSAERPRLATDCHLGAPRHRNWHVIGLPAGIKIVPGQQKKADRNVARGVVPGSAGDECGRDVGAPGRRRAPPWRPGRGDFILKVTQWKRGVAADKWFPSPYQALSLATTRPNISPSSSPTILYTVHFVLRILRPGWMENVEIFLVRSSLSSIFSAIARFFLRRERLALFWFIGCLRPLYLRWAGLTYDYFTVGLFYGSLFYCYLIDCGFAQAPKTSCWPASLNCDGYKCLFCIDKCSLWGVPVWRTM